MGILRVDHPDILRFIHCKKDGEITNFNISVAITDKFMQAYESNSDYDLIDPRTKEKVGKLSARRVFNEIAESAWKTGDPGLVFIDRRNKGKSSPVPMLGPIEATNPCGEQELYPYDACNLGSIFLTYFVKDESGRKEIDWEKLATTVKLATRFLDNVIEVNPFPLAQIRKTVFGIRRVGLGVGGWADALVDLGIAYDSEKALKLAEKVMKTVQKEAEITSQGLAKERGPFPLWHKSVYKRSNNLRRNATVTTIAPTGSISIIAGASSGIEPLFAIAYQHKVKDKHLDRTLNFVNQRFEEIVKERGLWSEELKEKVINNGVIREVDGIPEDIKSIFGTAHEIDYEWHIRMQAAFQKYTENAVSKTINMEKDVTEENVKNAYLLSWKTNCKGITVFRDGCKGLQVLNLGVKEENGELNKDVVGNKLWTRPMKISGSTYKIKTPVGTAFITVNHDLENNPIEVFINVGRAGSDVQAMAEALGRLISKTLKFGSHLTAKERAVAIIGQLKGIGGRRSVGFGANKIRSLPDAIAVALSTQLGIKINGNGKSVVQEKSQVNGEYQRDVSRGENISASTLPASLSGDLEKDGEERGVVATQSQQINTIGDICPSCGASSLVYEEGCVKCYGCGHSEC
jgi:ribonucleoside-diphosphate reductase alpha chain